MQRHLLLCLAAATAVAACQRQPAASTAPAATPATAAVAAHTFSPAIDAGDFVEHVKGGIKVEKPGTSWIPIHFGKHTPPRIIIGPNAVVDGPLVFEREVKLYVHASARTGAITGATAIRFDGAHAPPQD